MKLERKRLEKSKIDPLPYSCPTKKITEAAEATEEFGRSVGLLCTERELSVICFFGDLGAGKTTLIKGLAQSYAKMPPIEVNSPTFTYLNIYEGKRSIYHFDLYRLSGVDDFEAMGFDELLLDGTLCCIEWSERIESLIDPRKMLAVHIRHLGGDRREITLSQGKTP